MGRAIGLRLIVICLACLIGAAANAQELRAKILLVGDAEDPTLLYLRDELRLLALEIEVLEIADTSDLAALGRSRGADAVAHVEAWPPEVLIWMTSSEGSAESESIHVSDSLGEDAQPRLLALRAVELLRGRLLPVPENPAVAAPEPRAPPPAAPTPPPTAASAPPAVVPSSRPPRDAASPDGLDEEGGSGAPGSVSVFAAPALSLSPGGIPAAFQVEVALRLDLAWRLGLEAVGVLPTAATSLDESEGTVHLHILSLGGGPTLRLTEVGDAFSAHLAVGAAGVGIFFWSETSGSFREHAGSSWSAAPFVGLAAAYAALPWLSLRADVRLLTPVPEQVIRVAGREAAALQPPLTVIALGLELRP